MIRIGYVTTMDPESQAAWSGTIHTIYKALNKRYQVEPIIIKQNFLLKKILSKFSKLKIKLFHSAPYQDNTSVLTARIRSMRLKGLVNRFGSKKIDVLFIPAGSTYLSYSDFNIPVIYLSDATFHVMIDYYYTNLTKKQVENGNLIEKRAIENADKVIYSSDWAMNDAIDFYGINFEKCKMIPFGANMISPNERKPKSIKSKKNINLLFVGVDSKRKGLIIAVDTINELNKNISGYKFTLTVIGNDEKWLKDNDNINVLGFLDKNKNGDIIKIHNAYKAADLFILPTTAEAAGIVFAESSMYGLPILTYATGGVSTYVKNEVNGFTLPKNTKNFFEKIERLIENPGEYENMSYNAIQLYERIFNWDHWIADASKIIDDLVKKN